MSPGISKKVRARVRMEAGDRCGYCLSHQRYVLGTLEIDHIIPVDKGGSDDESNLWLACRLCNNHKSDHVSATDPETGSVVSLFNPRQQRWSNHFRWSDDSTLIEGLTPCGRATVETLRLNDSLAIAVRRNWVAAGWHPPQDVP